MSDLKQSPFQTAVDNTDIVSVIGQYIDLQKNGKDWKGICPFHDDSKPSLSVSPDRKVWRCFACGVGGNVIDFLTKYKHITNVEALKLLNNEYNLNLPLNNKTPKKNPLKESLKNVYKFAGLYYQSALNSKFGLDAKKYLKARGLTNDSINHFNLGYADSNESSLLRYLQTNKKISHVDLDNSKLFNGKTSASYDYYKNRIIFPIFNERNELVAFSGRTMTDEEPKYLISRETPIFKKSEIIYNFNNISKDLNEFKNLIVVEGFMDVIALYQLGIKNAVALLGTSLTSDQAGLLKKVKKEIIIFLDGDKPGQKATLKLAKQLLKEDIKFRIVINKTKSDPDELSKTPNGLEIIKNDINNAVNVVDWLVQKTNIETTKSEKDVQNIISVISQSTNPVQKELLINSLSSKIGISKEALKQSESKVSLNDTKSWVSTHENLFDSLKTKTIVKKANNKKWFCSQCHKTIETGKETIIFDGKFFDSKDCVLKYFLTLIK